MQIVNLFILYHLGLASQGCLVPMIHKIIQLGETGWIIESYHSLSTEIQIKLSVRFLTNDRTVNKHLFRMIFEPAKSCAIQPILNLLIKTPKDTLLNILLNLRNTMFTDFPQSIKEVV